VRHKGRLNRKSDNKAMRLAFLFVFVSLPTFAQAITAGVTGGVPVTNTFDTGFQFRGSFLPKTVRYTVGASVDFRLLGPLRAEVNTLYQPFSFDTAYYLGTPTYYKTSGNLWQFPVLLKFRLPTHLLRPFVEAGPSVQVASNIGAISYSLAFPAQVIKSSQSPNAVAGFAAGGGFDFRLGSLVVSPVARYTRWFSENFDFSETNHVGTHLNQVQVLLSIRI
jgi:hypothetical protein